MTAAYKCQGCGSYFDKRPDIIANGTIFHNAVIRIESPTKSGMHRLELCDSCVKKICDNIHQDVIKLWVEDGEESTTEDL